MRWVTGLVVVAATHASVLVHRGSTSSEATTDSEHQEEEEIKNGPQFMDKKIREIETLIKWKNLAPIPLLSEDVRELVTSNVDQHEEVNLGPMIGVSFSSNVFSIENHPDLAIKYQSDCDEKRPLHPLTREFFMLKRIEHLGISPVVYSVSDGARITDPEAAIGIKANTGALESCKKSKKTPSIRYLIMDRVGESIYAFVKRRGPVPVQAAAAMGYQLFEHIEKLSALNIIHGDIFERNVCFDRRGRLVLIDFGRSLIVKNAPPLARKSLSTFPLFSPWEMLGYRASFRDDCFRILQLIALLMNGKEYLAELDRLSQLPLDRQTGQPLVHFKSRGFIFELEGIAARPVTNLAPGMRESVSEALGAVLEYIRSLQLDEIPDFRRIKEPLLSIMQQQILTFHNTHSH